MNGTPTAKQIQKARDDRAIFLDLSHRTWRPQDAALLRDIPQLEELKLSQCQLSAVPEGVSTLTRLRYLYLFANELLALPETIGNLDSLVMLHLANNVLGELPDSIGKLTELDRIDADVNRLTTLPDSIGHLSRLRHANFSRNGLARLPESIGELQNLQWLNLDSNKLTELPEQIGNCASLETLFLRNNRLRSLPDSVGKLTNLTEFQPGANRLKTLPESIGNLEKLETLDLADNQLESLPDSIDELKINTLNLANNQLRALPTSLNRIEKLMRLRLSNNPLEVLPDDLDVVWLDISGCTLLRELPSSLEVNAALELGGTTLKPFEGARHCRLTWNRVEIDARIAFEPETITYQEIVQEENVERRRVMLERMGYDAFIEQADARIVDRDRDRGGKRQLLRIELPGDEPLVCLAVRCPSTHHDYILRVPPATQSCRHAAAWIAGFDNPDDYHPYVET